MWRSFAIPTRITICFAIRTRNDFELMELLIPIARSFILTSKGYHLEGLCAFDSSTSLKERRFCIHESK